MTSVLHIEHFVTVRRLSGPKQQKQNCGQFSSYWLQLQHSDDVICQTKGMYVIWRQGLFFYTIH